MISFYRVFIPRAASYTSGLSDLLWKANPERLVWSDELRTCFEQLKSALLSQPVFKLPDPSSPFVLRTDTSNQGLGAVILQYVQDYPHPVAYASRKLRDRERRYDTIEKECLAVIFGIKHFDYYLRGKELCLKFTRNLSSTWPTSRVIMIVFLDEHFVFKWIVSGSDIFLGRIILKQIS